MEPNTLNQIKEKLLEDKVRLEKELKEFSRPDDSDKDNFEAKFPSYGDDEESNAAEVADYGDRLSLEHALEIELRDVNKAIASLDAGKYGTCKYCGKPIDENRLLARPTSSSCVECKKKLKGEA